MSAVTVRRSAICSGRSTATTVPMAERSSFTSSTGGFRTTGPMPREQNGSGTTSTRSLSGPAISRTF